MLNQVYKIILIRAIVGLLGKADELIADYVLACVGEVAGEVHLEYPGVPGEAPADVIDILYHLVDCNVLAVAHTVIEGAVGQALLYERPEAYINVVVNNPH